MRPKVPLSGPVRHADGLAPWGRGRSLGAHRAAQRRGSQRIESCDDRKYAQTVTTGHTWHTEGDKDGTARCANTRRSLTHHLDLSERGLGVKPTHDDVDLCTPWTGSPGAYQHQAAVAMHRDRYVAVQPWHWISTTCPEPWCLNSWHMVIKAPQRLHYPHGVCVYCGRPGNTRDHLVPRSLSGTATRRYILTVPACGECNNMINDASPVSITERRAIAHRHIRRRYASKLATKVWSEAELDELGHTLRKHVEGAIRAKREVLERLAWPEDPAYDLRALERSGIENPYETGLLGESVGQGVA